MDMRKYRRQATWLCFESYLSEEQLLKAIRILEDSFQLNGTINLIAYVAKICMSFGINFETQKILYSRFYNLMSDTDQLAQVNDPLALLIEKEKLKSVDDLFETRITAVKKKLIEQKTEKLEKEKIETIDNVFKDRDMAVQQTETTVEQKIVLVPNLVFASFMSSVLTYTLNKPEVFEMLAELVADKKLQSQDLAAYIEQWNNDATSFTWAESLDEETLSRLVHLVYMSLCEVVGPIVTDEYFHKALAICEQQPEARIFSPSQFL
jgi:hypothetical protein